MMEMAVVTGDRTNRIPCSHLKNKIRMNSTFSTHPCFVLTYTENNWGTTDFKLLIRGIMGMIVPMDSNSLDLDFLGKLFFDSRDLDFNSSMDLIFDS